jgi:hypothetical protein
VGFLNHPVRICPVSVIRPIFEDFKHSEPLLIWWMESHFENIKAKCVKKLTENSMVDNNIEILYPIVHFHTRRQTCPDCEKLIQKSARKFGYVPIISFSSLYLTEKNIINSTPCKSSLNGKEERIMPFSTLKNNNFLDMDMLRQLNIYKQPRSKHFYLKKLYNVDEIKNSIDKDFDKKTIEELRDLDDFLKQKKRLKGIKRFPIQFYV